jgi:hypothetical protein
MSFCKVTCFAEADNTVLTVKSRICRNVLGSKIAIIYQGDCSILTINSKQSPNNVVKYVAPIAFVQHRRLSQHVVPLDAYLNNVTCHAL